MQRKIFWNNPILGNKIIEFIDKKLKLTLSFFFLSFYDSLDSSRHGFH